MSEEQTIFDRLTRHIKLAVVMAVFALMFALAGLVAALIGLAVARDWLITGSLTIIGVMLVFVIRTILDMQLKMRWAPVPRKSKMAIIVFYMTTIAISAYPIFKDGIRSIGWAAIILIPVLATIAVMANFTPQDGDVQK
jgi:hypothetical protein